MKKNLIFLMLSLLPLSISAMEPEIRQESEQDLHQKAIDLLKEKRLFFETKTNRETLRVHLRQWQLLRQLAADQGDNAALATALKAQREVARSIGLPRKK